MKNAKVNFKQTGFEAGQKVNKMTNKDRAGLVAATIVFLIAGAGLGDSGSTEAFSMEPLRDPFGRLFPRKLADGESLRKTATLDLRFELGRPFGADFRYRHEPDGR